VNNVTRYASAASWMASSAVRWNRSLWWWPLTSNAISRINFINGPFRRRRSVDFCSRRISLNAATRIMIRIIRKHGEISYSRPGLVLALLLKSWLPACGAVAVVPAACCAATVERLAKSGLRGLYDLPLACRFSWYLFRALAFRWAALARRSVIEETCLGMN
jgi:hypothetical protein